MNTATETPTGITTETATEITTDPPSPKTEMERLNYYRDLARHLDALPTERAMAHPTGIATGAFTWNEIEAITGTKQKDFRNTVGQEMPLSYPLTDEGGKVTPLGAYWCCHLTWFKARGGKPSDHKEIMRQAYRHLVPAPPSRGGTLAPRVETAAIADVEVEIMDAATLGHQLGCQFQGTMHRGSNAFVAMARQRGRAMGKAALKACFEEAEATFEAGMAALEGVNPEN